MNGSAVSSYSHASSFTTPLAFVSTATARKNSRNFFSFDVTPIGVNVDNVDRGIDPDVRVVHAEPYARPSLFVTVGA